MNEFNPKVGCGAPDDLVWAFGLGERHSMGDRLIEFCAE